MRWQDEDLKRAPAQVTLSVLFFLSVTFGGGGCLGFLTCPIRLSMRVKQGLGSRLGKQRGAG